MVPNPMKRFPLSSMSVVTIERYPNIAATKPLEETIGPPGVGREPEYFSTISPLTTKFKPSSSLVLGLPTCLKIKKGESSTRPLTLNEYFALRGIFISVYVTLI